MLHSLQTAEGVSTVSVLGIVAEYDPFHNGHLHHLREAVASAGSSSVIVAISGPFKQRGDAALFSPFMRAECALTAGADAVFCLPVLWTVRDAEHYALGAVHLLASLGADHLAFGAETADLALLQETAALLEEQPVGMQEALRALLSGGCGYPAALARAAGMYLPESGPVLEHPNNILAVCYIRAIRRLGLSMVPVVIPRSGAYHADQILPHAPSASALRDAFSRGSWNDSLSALPPSSRELVKNAILSGCIPDQKKLDTLLLDKLRSMTAAEAALLPDCPEGLDRALLSAASEVSSRKELILRLTSRRYPTSRISRLCTYALLGITNRQLKETRLPDHALLLALKKDPSLTGLWKTCPVRISGASDWLNAAEPADRFAWRIWTLASGLSGSFPYTQKIIS